MRRRMIWLTAALAVLLVLPAGPAAAADSALVSPDGDVTEPTSLQVELTREFGAERFSEVTVTLRRDGDRLGERVRLECIEGCEQTDRTATYALPDGTRLDPSTGAPFVDEPLANGAYRLRIDLDRGRFQSAQTFEHDLRLRVPASPPTDLVAEVEDDEVSLGWTRSSEPDVESYRLERHDGDGWAEVATTSSASATDEPGEGEHRYRVVALRPDGDGGELETPSDEVTVEIEPEDDEDERDADEDRDRNGERESDHDRDGDDDAEAGPPETDESASSAEGTSERDRGSRSGSATAPETGRDGSGSVPGMGEDNGEDGYSEELDYGEYAGGDEPVEVATPSGWRGATDRILDPERIAVPVAVGLVMTATGLHLWRWLRVV